MKWTYSGDPATSSLDETRFLIGDTEKEKPQVSDDEVFWAIQKAENDTTGAAVLLCQHLARKYSRLADCSVGDVSRSCSQIAKAYKDRADELTSDSQQIGMALPSFGGLSLGEKTALSENTDAVQPAFSVGMDDNPGAPLGREPGGV